MNLNENLSRFDSLFQQSKATIHKLERRLESSIALRDVLHINDNPYEVFTDSIPYDIDNMKKRLMEELVEKNLLRIKLTRHSISTEVHDYKQELMREQQKKIQRECRRSLTIQQHSLQKLKERYVSQACLVTHALEIGMPLKAVLKIPSTLLLCKNVGHNFSLLSPSNSEIIGYTTLKDELNECKRRMKVINRVFSDSLIQDGPLFSSLFFPPYHPFQFSAQHSLSHMKAHIPLLVSTSLSPSHQDIMMTHLTLPTQSLIVRDYLCGRLKHLQACKRTRKSHIRRLLLEEQKRRQRMQSQLLLHRRKAQQEVRSRSYSMLKPIVEAFVINLYKQFSVSLAEEGVSKLISTTILPSFNVRSLSELSYCPLELSRIPKSIVAMSHVMFEDLVRQKQRFLESHCEKISHVISSLEFNYFDYGEVRIRKQGKGLKEMVVLGGSSPLSLPSPVVSSTNSLLTPASSGRKVPTSFSLPFQLSSIKFPPSVVPLVPPKYVHASCLAACEQIISGVARTGAKLLARDIVGLFIQQYNDMKREKKEKEKRKKRKEKKRKRVDSSIKQIDFPDIPHTSSSSSRNHVKHSVSTSHLPSYPSQQSHPLHHQAIMTSPTSPSSSRSTSPSPRPSSFLATFSPTSGSSSSSSSSSSTPPATMSPPLSPSPSISNFPVCDVFVRPGAHRNSLSAFSPSPPFASSGWKRHSVAGWRESDGIHFQDSDDDPLLINFTPERVRQMMKRRIEEEERQKQRQEEPLASNLAQSKTRDDSTTSPGRLSESVLHEWKRGDVGNPWHKDTTGLSQSIHTASGRSLIDTGSPISIDDSLVSSGSSSPILSDRQKIKTPNAHRDDKTHGGIPFDFHSTPPIHSPSSGISASSAGNNSNSSSTHQLSPAPSTFTSDIPQEQEKRRLSLSICYTRSEDKSEDEEDEEEELEDQEQNVQVPTSRTGPFTAIRVGVDANSLLWDGEIPNALHESNTEDNDEDQEEEREEGEEGVNSSIKDPFQIGSSETSTPKKEDTDADVPLIKEELEYGPAIKPSSSSIDHETVTTLNPIERVKTLQVYSDVSSEGMNLGELADMDSLKGDGATPVSNHQSSSQKEANIEHTSDILSLSQLAEQVEQSEKERLATSSKDGIRNDTSNSDFEKPLDLEIPTDHTITTHSTSGVETPMPVNVSYVDGDEEEEERGLQHERHHSQMSHRSSTMGEESGDVPLEISDDQSSNSLPEVSERNGDSSTELDDERESPQLIHVNGDSISTDDQCDLKEPSPRSIEFGCYVSHKKGSRIPNVLKLSGSSLSVGEEIDVIRERVVKMQRLGSEKVRITYFYSKESDEMKHITLAFDSPQQRDEVAGVIKHWRQKEGVWKE
ncbi:hypothetical protein ADUPG1_012861 [Aduncisulcus paluster]|uniref:Uncharacterized protein n=1 Tax=Aduncisulcus paluster TaxID=2918883 RepID=A0ABQ5K2Q4_9EUKA|nr:hypothetical protein ADUPG1_012861 [Aduncisulcus paluster]